jgi:signal transduction histidine kinase
MPGMTGFAVLEELRKRPGAEGVPFIFLTAQSDRATHRQGMALGADDYVTKPFTVEEILGAIKGRLGRHRSLQERVESLMEERRREVSADWSHELMTPLYGVLGGLELIEAEGGEISPAELKDILGLIRAGAERQQRLSRQLVRHFELQRVLNGFRPGGLFQCEPGAVVGVAARGVAAAEKREADLCLEVEPGAVALPAGYLADAVVELVSNACRFSAAGRLVVVRGLRRGTFYVIEVADEGLGMTHEQRATVGAFVRFKQAAMPKQGLGLGLAIASAVAEIGGGRLTLESGPGERGLVATLILPVALLSLDPKYQQNSAFSE